MFINILKSKLHGATVTEANLKYVGSITIDEDLMDAASLIKGEQVHVLNLNNGARLTTYTITGKRGSGIICLNGPAARFALPDDKVIVISYAQATFEEAQQFEPTIVFLDDNNKIIKDNQNEKTA